MTETAEFCSKIACHRPSTRADLGRDREAVAQCRPPLDRAGSALRWGSFGQLFPELQSLVGVPQEPEWHPEGDVDIHTMMVVDEARKLIDGLDHASQSSGHARGSLP